MHKFLRAIGFSEINNRKDLQRLIKTAIQDASETKIVAADDNVVYGDYNLSVGENIGLAVCGEFNEFDEFEFDYFYPYMVGNIVSTVEKSTIEKHSAYVSFGGLCEDNKIGISIIYYLLDRIDYMKYAMSNKEKFKRNQPLYLSGLSDGGMIMMPIAKDTEARKKTSQNDKKRDKLIKAAREGSEEALESLTLEDIDVYSTISRKLKETDVYTIVDTYFMPYGIECDQYSVLGEIEKLQEVTNRFTGEELYQMSLNCNGMMIEVCINKKDLYGEPSLGRRFKGTIWLQGSFDNVLS